jgi:hypothetical protein
MRVQQLQLPTFLLILFSNFVSGMYVTEQHWTSAASHTLVKGQKYIYNNIIYNHVLTQVKKIGSINFPDIHTMAMHIKFYNSTL